MAPAIDFQGKDDDGGKLAELYRGRKRACKTKPVEKITLKKRRPTSILASADNNADVGDRSEKRRKIEETIALRFTANDLFPGCGSFNDYDIHDTINRGSYGVVYIARDTRTDQIVAVKEENDGLSLASMTEIKILNFLQRRRHRNIVEFKEVAVDNCGGVYVVLEYVKHDLRRYMNSRVLRLDKIKNLMKQLLEGVRFLHENMVMHRDIKPSNILVDEEGLLKICDFGLSKQMTAADRGSYSMNVGTLPYKAPELLSGVQRYSPAVDMWAVGCTMAELFLRGKLLFGGPKTEAEQLLYIYENLGPPGFEGVDGPCNPLRNKIRGGGAPLLTEAGFDLLRRLLTYDPFMRITALSALHHAWFQE